MPLLQEATSVVTGLLGELAVADESDEPMEAEAPWQTVGGTATEPTSWPPLSASQDARASGSRSKGNRFTVLMKTGNI